MIVLPCRLRTVAALVMACGFCFAAQAEQRYYKWIDQNGSTQYTQTPPPANAKKVLKTLNISTYQPSTSASTTAPAAAQSQAATNSAAPTATPPSAPAATVTAPIIAPSANNPAPSDSGEKLRDPS